MAHSTHSTQKKNKSNEIWEWLKKNQLKNSSVLSLRAPSHGYASETVKNPEAKTYNTTESSNDWDLEQNHNYFKEFKKSSRRISKECRKSLVHTIILIVDTRNS